MTTITVRSATANDMAFLARMFVEAALWRPEWPRVALEVLLENPQIAGYFAGWGRAGDVALVAACEGEPAGAAWFRRFSADAPGYGFVAGDVPELGIAVVASRRGRGVGVALLGALQRAAIERGHPGLSLSVHPDNPARRMYERLGFTVVEGDDSAITMLWRA
jgi:ribosomal protein S18 acetylase RimI-like enzyme